MNIYNHFTAASFVAKMVFLTALFGVVAMVPISVHAQTNLACPLSSNVQAILSNESNQKIGNAHSIEMAVINQNRYYMPGVRVAVALFSLKDQATPLFWQVGTETYMVAPATEMIVSLDSSLAMVPAGEYILKAFAFQGSQTDLLGAIFRDANHVEGVSLEKTTARETEISFSVSVDDKIVRSEEVLPLGHIPELHVETKNISSVPISNATLINIVSAGDIPLGGAVLVNNSDKTALLPNFARINEFSTFPYGIVTPGILLTTIIDDRGFTPVRITKLTVPSKDVNISWPHISRVGLSQYPLRADGEIIACVSYSGQWQQLEYVPELLQGSLKISSQDETLFNEQIYTDEVSSKKYFTFSPQMILGTFDMTFGLSQKRLNMMVEGSEEQMQMQIKSNLTIAEQKKFTLICNEESCHSALLSLETSGETRTEDVQVRSFWFYAGIVIAAALLMYLMLRRLNPVSPVPPTEKINPEELQ